MNNYELDTKAAKQATEGGYIEDTGKYIGIIKRAELVQSKNTGTEGFEFEIQTESKQSCTFTIWTIKADGTRLRGFNLLQALMTCLRVKGLTFQPVGIEKYDYVARERRTVQCNVAVELMDKKVGFLLEREDYIGNNGDDRHRMNLFANFDDKEMVASEILAKKTQPEELPKLLSRLLNAKPKQQKQQAPANSPYPTSNQSSSSNGADLDDDLPF